ncbi:MAG: hypothetical protein ACYTGC_14740 [Planctomycetota bacterium]|jgi:hypothetical protein
MGQLQMVPAAPVATHEAVIDMLRRIDALERLIRRIEDELSDEEIDDEQKLQNIGERVAKFIDGQETDSCT